MEPSDQAEIVRGASWEIEDASGTSLSRLVLEPGPARFEQWGGRRLVGRWIFEPAEREEVAARFDAGREADHPTTEDVSFACSSTLTLRDGAWRRILRVGNGVFSGGPIVALLEALAERARRGG
jgi:hypothetical protein